jgi:hypothetical protein
MKMDFYLCTPNQKKGKKGKQEKRGRRGKAVQ